jgi:GT2 family glycosyltransferase
MEKIVVIVVTYNGMKWIDECLKSVLNSSIPVSVIVVDNNSADTTVDFIKTSFPDVILLQQKENLGFGKANNIGMTYALRQNADFVFLLNQDAKVEKNTIDELIKVSKLNENFGVLTPLHLNWQGTEIEYGFYNEKMFSDLLLHKKQSDFYLENKFINAAAWLLPLKTINRVGGFDPIFFHYGEDVNYCQRVLFHGFKLVIVPKVKIFHDTPNNGVLEKIDKSKQLMIDERYFRNQTIIKYGDVNRLDYKLYNKFKIKVIFRTLYSLLLFDFTKAREDFRKYKILTEINIKESYLKNSKEGRNHF